MKKHLMNKKTLCFLVVFTLLTACKQTKKNGMPHSRNHNSEEFSENKIYKIVKGEINERVTTAGKLIPKTRALISAPYEGFIQKIWVQVGQEVKYLQPLISIANNLDNHDVPIYPLRSPIAGTVVSILKQEGERVEKGSDSGRLILVDDISYFLVQASVPESQIFQVKKNMQATIRFQALMEKKFKGTVIEVSQAESLSSGGGWGETSTSQYAIKIRLDEKDLRLKSGMGCLVDIILNSKNNVLVIPQEYVARESNDKDFYVTLLDGQKKSVSLGIGDNTHFEILSGINEGDEVQMVDFLSLPQNF